MKISSPETRARMQQAVELFRDNDQALPNNLTQAVAELRSIDPLLALRLENDLQKDE